MAANRSTMVLSVRMLVGIARMKKLVTPLTACVQTDVQLGGRDHFVNKVCGI